MVLDGLDPNTEYYINVTAVTLASESDSGNVLRVVTLPEVPVPAAGMGACVHAHSCTVYILQLDVNGIISFQVLLVGWLL